MHSIVINNQIKKKANKKKNTFIVTVVMLFISFSVLNIVLILNFLSVLNSITIGMM